MMLPPDLREWVAADDMVHVVLEAVEAIPQASFEVNYRGTGSAQYPPHMLSAHRAGHVAQRGGALHHRSDPPRP